MNMIFTKMGKDEIKESDHMKEVGKQIVENYKKARDAQNKHNIKEANKYLVALTLAEGEYIYFLEDEIRELKAGKKL